MKHEKKSHVLSYRRLETHVLINWIDTCFRIHGTTELWPIGALASNGCIRIPNDHVMQFYDQGLVKPPEAVL